MHQRVATAVRERFGAQADTDGAVIDDLPAARQEVAQAVSSGQDRWPG